MFCESADTLSGVEAAAERRLIAELERAERLISELERAAVTIAEIRAAAVAEIRVAPASTASNSPGVEVSPLLVSATQASAILGIGRTRLYELIKRGDIEPVRIGRRNVRFSMGDLNSFVERGGVQA